MRLHSETTDTGDNLVVEVSDDRPAVNWTSKAGVGLAAMRERANELGGSCGAGPASYRICRVEDAGISPHYASRLGIRRRRRISLVCADVVSGRLS